MSFSDIIGRYRFWKNADRIGPDIPLTHWKLLFSSTMRDLCVAKFKNFGAGAEFRSGAYAIVCSRISIGNNVVIRPGTMLFADPEEKGAEIIIENNVLVGSGVHIYTQNHHFNDPTVPIIKQGHSLSKTVRLKEGCWIGANAIILPGVEVGVNAVIGAGSIVTRSVPAKVVVAGNPARIIRTIG